MKIIKPSYEIDWHVSREYMLKTIEKYGRKCYQSSHKITEDSYLSFVKNRVKEGHLGLLEHQIVSVTYICDRGVTHELVRHRIASFLQESTRYCNYSKSEIEFIDVCPFFKTEKAIDIWVSTMRLLEERYNELISLGEKPEIARSILPNSLKSEITETANLRQWKYQLELRTSSKCHPQMRELTIPLLEEFKKVLPEVFCD